MIYLDEAYNKLNKKVEKMMQLTITNHKNSVEALVKQDAKLALKCIENDEIINNLEEQINYEVLVAIAKFQPVATDLRKLIGLVKVATDIERIADYSKTISKAAILNCDQTFMSDEFIKNVSKISKVFIDMFKRTINTFIELDISEIHEIVAMDLKINNLVLETLKANPFKLIDESNVETYMLLMGVIRNLERAGDHTKNICESIVFIESGLRVEY